MNATIRFIYSFLQVHRSLRFDQKPIKRYRHVNTIQRANASNKFEKNFFKLMKNSLFGKTMENLRNRRNITLANCQRKLMRLVAQPSFKGYTIFHEDLIAIEKAKVELVLN